MNIIKLIISFIVNFFLISFSFAQSQNISGVYTTEWGDLSVTQSGKIVTGSSLFGNTKIEGIIEDSVLIGTWTRTNGNGRIVFTFSKEGFSGKWCHSSTPDNWQMNWSGKKKSAENSLVMDITGIYITDWGDLTITQKGKIVTGFYSYKNGKIEGVIENALVAGIWTQNDGNGKIIFTFTNFGFTGKWCYASSPDKWESNWNGRKK